MCKSSNLRENTIKDENIIKTSDGYFRYVNHDDKLLTTGFKYQKMLKSYGGMIRFEGEAVEIMRRRYVSTI